MRVYTRGVDEGLVIGKSLQINVLEVQSNCVRLAIIDPDASPTYREEMLYLPSAAEDCDMDMDVDMYSVIAHDESSPFQDEDSRLIPMA
jgi:carbon storage regulator CsrA